MSLDHALLVSLMEKPSSGYELARRFDKSIGHFWHATHQQIYRVLARMEAAGWIVGETKPGNAAPDRRIFSPTTSGRRAVSDWLTDTPSTDSFRSTLMIKLRAAAFDDPRRLLPELQTHLAEHQRVLADYRQIEARDFDGPLDAQRALQHQVLKLGIATEQNWTDWLQEALDLIDRLTGPTQSNLKSQPRDSSQFNLKESA